MAEERDNYLLRPEALVPGNRVRLLHDGAQAYPRMLAAIAAATRTVRLEIYHFAGDATGRLFGEALVAAAARGVEVTVLYDAVGTWDTRRRFLRGLAAGGVRLRKFRPLWPWPVGRLMHLRDHRKILIIDGARAFVGGMNIADAWSPAQGQAWRDLMVEFEGPATANVEGVFRATWRSQGPDRFAERHRPHHQGEVSLGVLAARKAIHGAYLHAIERARESGHIAAGYFVPDAALISALQGAAARGVEVSLILPGRSDHRMIQSAGRATYARLLASGVRIFEWLGTMLHVKTAVVDGVWSTIGSFNLDSFSRLHNHELNVVFTDRALAGVIRDKLVLDQASSVRIEPAAWRRRPWRQKLREGIATLFRRWL